MTEMNAPTLAHVKNKQAINIRKTQAKAKV